MWGSSDTYNKGKKMKNLATKLLMAATAILFSIEQSMASGCGVPGNPCDVPEPGTASLFVGALGVAALVAKFRKK